MILTVEEFRQYYQTEESDAILESKLNAIELMVRAYTNNNFQWRGICVDAAINDSTFTSQGVMPFEVGDTVQVTKSGMNDGVYTVTEVLEYALTVNESTRGVDSGRVTLVKYPQDVKMGVVNLMKWELEMRDNIGIQMETISKHMVTYVNPNTHTFKEGYPGYLMSFLDPYKRARFGGGASQ